jgi:PPK2 family polyphosphate:nucleotide phosphotransferase
MKLKPVESERDIKIDDADARVRHRKRLPHSVKTAAEKEGDRIAHLQRLLYADRRYALLIVLQGRDASGKDGTIRKVFTSVNPQGCEVSSFGVPTELERRHDFLWRIHMRVPARGMIGIFNRSHYEDILVPRVHGQLDKSELRDRYRQINDFERLLAENGTVILKFMLNVSRNEQRKRLEERLLDETKNWKFRVGDLDDRQHWDEFSKAYHGILKNTSTEGAPWYIVPADDKDVRDWLVARTIADTLENLELRYPPADPAVKDLKIE